MDPVQVTFVKPSEKHRLCAWTAIRGRRTVVPGTVMAAGAGLPHDLAQYVVEATFGVATGFWGLVARGAHTAAEPRHRMGDQLGRGGGGGQMNSRMRRRDLVTCRNLVLTG